VVEVFDAALLVESGLPARALDVLGGIDSTRAHLIRAQALIDLGATDPARLPKALEEAEKAIAGAPDNLEAQALLIWAKVLTAAPKQREELIRGDLNGIANKMVSKRGRHVEGAALQAIGNPDARSKLEEALANVDAANPNPIAYRTHLLLARMDLADGKIADAAVHVDAALTANGGYLPAMVVKARILLAAGDADGALATLKPVLLASELVTVEVELAHAEALAAHTDATSADRKAATEALRRALAAGAPPAEVGRIAALISAELPAELGVPGAPGAETPEEEPAKPAKKRHR
jgi:tetratricopeptide (TPR) repeat protein